MQCIVLCFFFNDTATTEIYTLSLHDALPISTETYDEAEALELKKELEAKLLLGIDAKPRKRVGGPRSEEHTSELQSRQYLVCRLLLEKKKEQKILRPGMPKQTRP